MRKRRRGSVGWGRGVLCELEMGDESHADGDEMHDFTFVDAFTLTPGGATLTYDFGYVARWTMKAGYSLFLKTLVEQCSVLFLGVVIYFTSTLLPWIRLQFFFQCHNRVTKANLRKPSSLSRESP
jgi:hypothetical protein